MPAALDKHLQQQDGLVEADDTAENVVTRYEEGGGNGYTARLVDDTITVDVFSGPSFAVEITDTGYDIRYGECEGDNAAAIAEQFTENVLAPRNLRQTPPEVQAQTALQSAYDHALGEDPYTAALEVGEAAQQARAYLEDAGLQPTDVKLPSGHNEVSDIRVQYGDTGRSRSPDETGIDHFTVRTADGVDAETTQLAYGMARILLQDAPSSKDSISTDIGYKPGADHHKNQDVVATGIVEAFDQLYDDLDFRN
ncbi:MAG: hypothetical protein SVY41_01605 [Candidatus Nanohaloarchaea archaeon]|nr:hypothetical protein [Candidatus Nanohaloarchaea archaeon]